MSQAVTMLPVLFASPNNPERAGQRASRKVLFGEFNRYAVWAVHTRFDRVCWMVADAQVIDPVTGGPDIIRQADTQAEAVEGLE